MMAKKTKSPSFEIDKKGLKKVGKGFLIGLAGLALTGAEQAIPFLTFLGEWNPIVVTLNATLANFFRKLIASY